MIHIRKFSAISRHLNGTASKKLRFSDESMAEMRIHYNGKLRAALKTNPELNFKFEDAVSRDKTIKHWAPFQQLYNIKQIREMRAKHSPDIFNSAVVVKCDKKLNLSTSIKIFKKEKVESSLVFYQPEREVEVKVDDDYDVKFGALTANLTSKGYNFEAFNIKLHRKDNPYFITPNNDMLSEITGFQSCFLEFVPKNSTRDYKDMEIIQLFRENIPNVTYSEKYLNFMKVGDFYFVIRNSDLLVFSKGDYSSKQKLKELKEIFDSVQSHMRVKPSRIFDHLDVKSNTLSSLSLIEDVLRKGFSKAKAKILRSLIMESNTNKDIIDALTAYSPSKEYSLTLIQLLDKDIKPAYRISIKELREPNFDDVVEKLKLIARTEPEIHHMTSILSNFENAPFIRVLELHMWKILSMLESSKVNVIDYSYNAFAESKRSHYYLPKPVDTNLDNITVFTDASLNNEVSATGQIYYVNNRIAYMESVVDNTILSYIEGAELHAVVSAAKKTQVIKDFLEGFCDVKKNPEITFYVDNTNVLNAMALQQSKKYSQKNVKLFEYLNSVELENFKMLYVPSECNVADGLTKMKFNDGLYGSIWFKQFRGKNPSTKGLNVDELRKKSKHVNQTLNKFKELSESNDNLYTLQEMEELYEKHSNDIMKKDQILSELEEIGRNCFEELKVVDETLRRTAAKCGIELQESSDSSNISDLNIIMQALNKEVDYTKQLGMITKRLSSNRITLTPETTFRAPLKLTHALNSRNNILDLWELSIEEKIQEIGEFFDKKERLRFKSINDKYESMKELEAQRQKRYNEWKEYLKNEKTESSTEAREKLLQELVSTNHMATLREEKQRQKLIEEAEVRRNIELEKEKAENSKKKNFSDTLDAMIEYNKAKENSGKLPAYKQKELDMVFAELEKKKKLMIQARKTKEREEAKKAELLRQQSHNPEVDFENTTSVTVGYPFEKVAGFTRGDNLTPQQKAKLASVIKMQQVEVTYRKQQQANELKLLKMSQKKKIVDQYIQDSIAENRRNGLM